MATVINAAQNGAGFLDKTLVRENRTNAGSPVASLTPQFVGEIVYDSTGKTYYRGTGVSANTQWAAVIGGVVQP